MSATNQAALSVHAIPAFSDNYIWLLHRGGNACAVVDPGESEPVIKMLEENGLDLKYILLTHHHFDHIGGAKSLLDRYPLARAFGPDDRRIDFASQACREGERVLLPEIDLELEVIEVPAHTRSHIAFHGDGILFSGDTLFSVGCGRLFEGTADQMQAAMDKLAALPPQTRIYCGHEYTLSNCEFARKVEPDNETLAAKMARTRKLREEDQVTLPATLEEELAVNPFMRTRQPAVVAAAQNIDPAAQPGASVLGVIRRWKDES